MIFLSILPGDYAGRFELRLIDKFSYILLLVSTKSLI